MGVEPWVKKEIDVVVDGGVHIMDLFQFIYEQRGRCRLRDVNRKSKRNATELHAMLLKVMPRVTVNGEPFTVEHMQKLMEFTAKYADTVDDMVKDDDWFGREYRKLLKANPNNEEYTELAARPLTRERVAAVLKLRETMTP
jgi:hypothetical protein